MTTAQGIRPVSTVSRVLNNVAGIGPEVQRRVWNIATELGHQAPPPRAGKVPGTLRHVGLFATRSFTNANHDQFHTEIMIGVEAECRRLGLHLSYTVIEPGAQGCAFVTEKVEQSGVYEAVRDRLLRGEPTFTAVFCV